MNDPGRTVRVLVVEDDHEEFAAIRAAIGADGLSIDARCVDDDVAFSDALSEFAPDVIVCHLRPARLSGYLALALARSLKSQAAFLLVCDPDNEAAAVEGLRRGAADYVLTPHLPRLAPITRRALAELVEREARERAEKELFRAQRYESLALLASGLSHDLRNVLQPILTCSTIFADSPDEKMQRAARMVEDCAQRGLDIVTSMLSFAKGSPAARERVKVDTLLEALDALVSGTMPENIALYMDAPDAAVELDGNYTELQQCLLNLCLNAMQAMPDGGELRVCVDYIDLGDEFFRAGESGVSGRYLRIRIRDTGTGMSGEDQARLFSPFFTTKDDGTGLGLFSCQRIISNHKGFIRVESALGAGTTFTLYLPLPTAHPVSGIEAPALLGHGETVLVVVERAGKLSLLHDALELQGYSVLSAQSGAAAIRMLRNGKLPDAVIMEADMSLITGVPTASALLERDYRGPVLMIARGATADRDSLPPLRRIRFVDKPVNVAQVVRVLAEELRATRPCHLAREAVEPVTSGDGERG